MKQKQVIAVELLAVGMPIEEASDKLGISKVTLYRWLKDTEFSEELERRSKEVLSGLSRKLAGLTVEHIEEFESLLTSSNEGIKLRAWGINLSRLTDIIEIARLEDRVRVLEQSIGKDA